MMATFGKWNKIGLVSKQFSTRIPSVYVCLCACMHVYVCAHSLVTCNKYWVTEHYPQTNPFYFLNITTIGNEENYPWEFQETKMHIRCKKIQKRVRQYTPTHSSSWELIQGHDERWRKLEGEFFKKSLQNCKKGKKKNLSTRKSFLSLWNSNSIIMSAF